jgi:RES domain-containing protein
MRAYRIVDARRGGLLLDGSSAARTGGRWNRRGIPAVYASLSVSLAILEAMHQEAGGELAGRFHLGVIAVPPARIERLERAVLPPRWRELSACTREIGTRWLRGGVLALQVPSAIHDHEDNLLLNPGHPDFRLVTLESSGPLKLWKRLCAEHDAGAPGEED